ncbi:MAG TPA: hypothetical protein VK889_07185 [Solirubrobacterales bacterium]|nr:hypothetical protein [Solirubrobacterales bacterium]
MEWTRRNAPTVLFALVLLAAGMLLLALSWNTTFFQDTWAFILDRRGWSANDFLKPHNEHLVPIPVLVTKLQLELFGMGNARPEIVAMAATALAAAALLFVYVRRRLGPWPALLAGSLFALFGAAWPILLWPFQIEFTGPLMAGLATLLLLEREDRRGDALACLALVVTIAFGSLGLPFLAAVAVEIFLKRDARGLGRAYVVAVPVAFYGAWYLGWGHVAEDHLTLANVLNSPQYAMDGFASSAGALAGLSSIPVNSPGEPEWGRPLLLALIGLALFVKWRRPGISPYFWPVAAAAITYWFLAAFNYIPGREAYASRYLYGGGAFVLLMAASLLEGVRFSPRALAIGAVLTVLAIGPNLASMKDGAAWMREQSVITRADTAALEIARDTVSPYFPLAPPEVAGTASLSLVSAALYFDAVEEYGSPAYSPGELLSAPESGRRWADVVLSKALPLSLETRPDTTLPHDPGRCTILGGGEASEVELRPGVTRIWVGPGPEAKLFLRRFAQEEFPVQMGALPGGSLSMLEVPRDRAPQPWYLRLLADQETRLCR